MNNNNLKANWGTIATFKYLSPTNTKGARWVLKIRSKRVGIFPYDYSKMPSEQFVARLQDNFSYWKECIISYEKDLYVAMVTMGTEL